ncbi:hypothetical protein JTB14_036468 [Gonioctena quinquepunctata]|nr:hypothetical protein JTB14_036468 [Gonioctena quinquepunctata]
MKSRSFDGNHVDDVIKNLNGQLDGIERRRKEAIDLIRRHQAKQSGKYNQGRFKATYYQPGDLIMVKREPPSTEELRKLASKFMGPHVVTEKLDFVFTSIAFRMKIGTFVLLALTTFISESNGHGRLIEPPSRASAWRYGFNTPHNYNDHELFCGGFTRQWVKNEGKCGVCGDPWDSKTPRAHEFGGTYGQGIIVRKYAVGSIITIRIELTAIHNGYFEFSICPNYQNPTQDCLDQNILKLVKTQENVEDKGSRYFPKDGNKVYEMKFRLPNKSCEHCLLQWRYIAGNNWGTCTNGTGAIGCGPQEEFRACADITIAGKSDQPLVPELEEPSTLTPPISTVIIPTVPVPEETYNPISTLFISLISFLLVFSIFFLLYFHFYQIGNQVKNWIKGPKDKATLSTPPQAPPRAKRARSPVRENTKDGLHEIDLRRESLA